MAIPRDYFEWAAREFDPTRIHEKPEALKGIRVLDLSVIYFGPATADFLGEFLQMPAWRMTRTPPRLKWACRPAGYHTAHVLNKYFGYGPAGVARLRGDGVI